MDKKLFRALAAALIFAAVSVNTGCKDKENEKPQPAPVPTESKTAGNYHEEISEAPEVTEKPEFREYAETDFKDVNLNVSMVNKEPPVEVSSVDISGFDFGEKVPLCNKEEYAEKYYNEKNEAIIGQPVYMWQDFVNQPVKGIPVKSCIWNGKCYIYVLYEIFFNVYDWEIYRCDMSGNGLEKVYSWTAKDINNYCDNYSCFSNGGLFYIYHDENDNATISGIKRIDLETGNETDLLESSDIGLSLWLQSDNSGNIELQEYHNLSNDASVYYKYDNDNGELVKVENAEVSDGQVRYMQKSNGIYSYLIKPDDGRKFDLVNDYYRIKTPLTTGSIVYADEKIAVLYNNVRLHIYNLEKMEHCVMNAEDFGDNKVMYNGMLFMGSRNKGLKMPVYCMIPEIGITYSIVEAGIYTDICATQDGVTFNEVSQDLREIPGYEYYDGNSKYVYIGGYSNSYDRIDKIYSVRMK